MAIRLPRCAKHKNAKELPVLCHTCQRINVEHIIVTKLVDDLIAKGYKLEEQSTEVRLGPQFTAEDREDFLDTLFDLDDAAIIVDGERMVRLVFGNDGYDVISDYNLSLEDDLQEANDLASTFDV